MPKSKAADAGADDRDSGFAVNHTHKAAM
jgi:hypothetical protein